MTDPGAERDQFDMFRLHCVCLPGCHLILVHFHTLQANRAGEARPHNSPAGPLAEMKTGSRMFAWVETDCLPFVVPLFPSLLNLCVTFSKRKKYKTVKKQVRGWRDGCFFVKTPSPPPRLCSVSCHR